MNKEIKESLKKQFNKLIDNIPKEVESINLISMYDRYEFSFKRVREASD